MTFSITVDKEDAVRALVRGQDVSWHQGSWSVRARRIGHSDLWGAQDLEDKARFAVLYGRRRDGFGEQTEIGDPFIAAEKTLTRFEGHVAAIKARRR